MYVSCRPRGHDLSIHVVWTYIASRELLPSMSDTERAEGELEKIAKELKEKELELEEASRS